MMIEEMIAAVDGEIARLSLVRKLLAGDESVSSAAAVPVPQAKKVRSAETRERMAAAQQKRWAAIRKTEKKPAK